MFTFADLFQQPYYFRPASLAIHPRLAAEIAYLVRRQQDVIYSYEALMLEPPASYGPGFQESGENHGFGASFTNPAEALAKSVFEAWERKFSKVFDAAELVNGSYHALGKRAVSPEAFALISDWEFQQSPLNYIAYHPELPLSWKECYRVIGKSLEPVLIPATFVYSRFSWKHPDERFAPNLSPGLACHVSLREAFLSGLCELVERDAFMLAWLHRASPCRIRAESRILAEANDSYDYFHGLGFVIHFLNLTTDLYIPVVLTVMEHPDLPWDGTLVMGLGCAMNPEVALRKSLLEAFIMLNNYIVIDSNRSEMTVRRQPLRFGLQAADYYRKIRFLLSNPHEVSIAEVPNHDRNDAGRNLELLIDHLNGLGHATYFVDLTPRGYENCRICLSRAFIAGLQPMLYEPDCWRLNPNRLFGAHPPIYEQLNLMPHPWMLLE